MFFLVHSPFGPIVLNDFRREQFILVDGEIKLTDLDDIGFQERQCLTENDCSVVFSSSSNFTLRYAVISVIVIASVCPRA